MWRIERRLSAHPTRYGWTAERSTASASYRVWVRHLWYSRWVAWTRRLAESPWSAAWFHDALCVHHYEGAWNDPGAPYWGGLQMDLSFQQAYGAAFVAEYGTADHWPPHDQLLAAYRAWRLRGWEPWPNTARACGLL